METSCWYYFSTNRCVICYFKCFRSTCEFWLYKVEWPLIMVILGSLFVGAIAAVLVSTGSSIQLKKQVKQQGKELTTFDQKVAERTESLKAEYENKLAEKEIALAENKKKIDSLEQELVTKLTTPPTENTL